MNLLSNIHWEKVCHDMTATTAAVIATFSVHAVGDWLQVGVLVLTIVFLSLGITMRFRKLKDDDPTKD